MPKVVVPMFISLLYCISQVVSLADTFDNTRLPDQFQYFSGDSSLGMDLDILKAWRTKWMTD
ncbi:hypothetical protein EYZ11_011945 [Aspergillus tanneri]|uniref:Uncharacterized protein n=1 Tax=Aspergillus tanneri TaxID=1220188 RepID=A0A4V3UMU0_9EURO|nr:hypothetical protein EYZ11_011945 [Aspergillus tanneri]